MQYTLNANCPVKWTVAQEKAISRELPGAEILPGSAADFVAHTYRQALWLPDSIMPLDCLVPAMSSISSRFDQLPSSSSGYHPLHHLVQPMLLTPRLITEKYQKRICALMDEDDTGKADPDDELMWYALRNDKGGLVDEAASEEEHAAEEGRWRQAWLTRMEQRETMVQVLLHLLLISIPGLPQTDVSPKRKTRAKNFLIPTTSPRPLKQTPIVQERGLSISSLEDRLEALMDRLAMWQLVDSIDKSTGNQDTSQLPQGQLLTSLSKGKQKAAGDRDWMQTFCEDVIEPLFQTKLPALCSLLRSKVFQESSFADDLESLSLSGSPPASPKIPHNRYESSEHTAAAAGQSETSATRSSGQTRDLSRTKSLSISLEAERVRERSRSLSVGPGHMHKRALAREVSMTTAFKGKTRQKAEDQRARRSTLPKIKSSANATRGEEKSRTGTTLVAATPVKPKPKAGRGPDEERDVLPIIIENAGLFAGGQTQRAVEGDDEDEDWLPQSSPDVLLLTAECPGTPEATGGETVKGQIFSVRRRVLVEATPTKPKRLKG